MEMKRNRIRLEKSLIKANSIINQVKENTFIIQSLKTIMLRVFGIALLFGFTLYLTHHYDPKIIGQYDFIRTYLLVVGSICLLGNEQSILYFNGRLRSINAIGELKTVYKKMVLMIFLICVFIFLVIILIDESVINNYFNDVNLYLIVLKTTGILFFYSLTLLNTEAFRALDSVYVAELYRNTFKYTSVILGSILLIYIHKEVYLVDTFLVGFVFLGIISTYKILNLFNKEVIIVNKNDTFTYTHILKKSYPMAISAMAIFLLMSFDIIFLKKYWGDKTVAFYAVAVKIMTIVAMIINIVNVNMASKVAEYFSSNNKAQLIKTLKHASRLIFIFTLPITLLVCFFPTFILSFFGQEYTAAKGALVILIIGQGVCSIFGLAPVYLNMTGRQHLFQIILIISVIINFSLNRFLIPYYGISGAAFAFSASMFFWNFTAAVIIYYKDKVPVFLT